MSSNQVPAPDYSVIQVVALATVSGGVATPVASNGGTFTMRSVTATGANYVAFASFPCRAAEIVTEDTPVEVIRGSETISYPLPAYSSHIFEGLTNLSQLSVRRTDQAAVNLVVKAEVQV